MIYNRETHPKTITPSPILVIMVTLSHVEFMPEVPRSYMEQILFHPTRMIFTHALSVIWDRFFLKFTLALPIQNDKFCLIQLG